MPEFVLNTDKTYDALDDFTKGYIECIFFTNQCSHGDDTTIANWWNEDTQSDLAEGATDGCLPSDCGTEHIHPDSLAAVAAHCAKWQADYADLLAQAYERGYTAQQAGNDLWYDSQGHGVGFTDREELGNDTLLADSLGDLLSEAAGRSEVQVWFGDHTEHGNAPFVYIAP